MHQPLHTVDLCFVFIKFWMNKEKLTRMGFEPATSGLMVYIGGLPILSISLFLLFGGQELHVHCT